MDLLAAFRVFIRVAEAQSFSAVAREMGTTQPAVSRQVAALEEHLGARLIQRTTRSLALTEDGRDLLGHARRVLDSVEEAEAAVGRRHALPGGLVRLATSSTFGRLYVAPRMPRLLERYPELSIELRMSDTLTDLVADGIDLAVRVTQVQDSSLVARKIGSSRRIAVASEACIAAYGEPRHPSDLDHLPCIIFTGSNTPGEWQFEGAEGSVTVHVTGRFRTDNGEGVREAVLAGLGYALLPTWFFGTEVSDGRLRPVLTGWEPPPTAITAVYPSRRNLAPRTRAVIDFFVDEFRLDPMISAYGEA
ncbi:LysR family transcriptional regulator [Acidisphaera sp. L21]|jgi:DNA-binding transcriptional LysR family regulator|uniref:LysR family transcriptional regulator n=1 Tax=Acidisphaera sp. L21 TaxID=1641851 RepID=UPI00131C85E9|nr:LysR family transcriptional regulator [Acidisphaera sp. L21]